MSKKPTRRIAIKNIIAGTAAGLFSTAGARAAGILPSLNAAADKNAALSETESKNYHHLKLKGTINHSVCRWCYGDIALDELCLAVKKIGFSAIDLVGPADWPTLQKHGIYSSMCNGAEIGLTKGWNHTEYHPTLIKNYTEHFDPLIPANFST